MTGSGSIVDATSLHLGLLNDTGINYCANLTSSFQSNAESSCELLTASYPGQDGQLGRDAYARQSKLFKIGSGDAGFDYTPICNNGAPAGSTVNGNSCPGNPTLGSASNQWGCTQDNVTGLIWEVKTQGGAHDMNSTYAWYNTNSLNNGGSSGNNCTTGVCNTATYVQAVNQQSLCGASDWRMPTRHELHSMAHHGRSNPSVDSVFFPNTVADAYWSATPMAINTLNAWYVNFAYGWDYADNKNNAHYVRLVRNCGTNCNANNPIFYNPLLHLPLVQVGTQFYDASLTLIPNGNTLTFQLLAATAITAPTGSTAPAIGQATYATNGQLTINSVLVGGHYYNATLLLVGSNPMQFALQNAQLLQ